MFRGQVGYALQLNDRLTLTPSLRTSWADKDHMQSYFGVSQDQAATSVHSRFDAKSGIKSVSVGAELGWTISENWMFSGNLGFSRLTGDAADSPLVKNEGSANQFMAVAVLAYKF